MALLSLHISKYHIVGNLMSRLKIGFENEKYNLIFQNSILFFK